MNQWSLIAMAGALLGAVSCTPVGGPLQGANGGGANGSGMVSAAGNGAPAGSVGSGRATSGDLRELRERRQSAGNEQLINGGRTSTAGGRSNTSGEVGAPDDDFDDELNLPPLPPMNIDYRYAMPVPGRPGWVYNPYTNRPVDVRGVGSGRLIYDERDPENRNEDGTLRSVAEMPNKFRVP